MICIPITAGTHAGAMRAVERSAASADVIELRMDLIHNGRLGELINRIRICGKAVKVLVTHRPKTIRDALQEKRRIDGLKDAVGLGADFVDVELQTDPVLMQELVKAIDALQRRTALIVSHHDFERTPSLRTLKALLRDCIDAGADIAKIVTWARRSEDNLRVLGLIAGARRKDIALITFCMGPHGRISRLAAPMLGSYLSYVSLHKGARSAPGQLTIKEMNTSMKILRVET
jgi:3-dehydroquinate dehydratase type I